MPLLALVHVENGAGGLRVDHGRGDGAGHSRTTDRVNRRCTGSTRRHRGRDQRRRRGARREDAQRERTSSTRHVRRTRIVGNVREGGCSRQGIGREGRRIDVHRAEVVAHVPHAIAHVGRRLGRERVRKDLEALLRRARAAAEADMHDRVVRVRSERQGRVNKPRRRHGDVGRVREDADLVRAGRVALVPTVAHRAIRRREERGGVGEMVDRTEVRCERVTHRIEVTNVRERRDFADVANALHVLRAGGDDGSGESNKKLTLKSHLAGSRLVRKRRRRCSAAG